MKPTAAEREDAATRALLQPDETTLGTVTLRPLTLGSLSLLKVTRNEFLIPAGPEQLDAETGAMLPTVANEIFAALAFAYIHGAPLDEVRRVVWSETVFRDKVLAWGEEIPVETMAPLMGQIERTLIQIKALEFAVKPKDQTKTGDEPPN